MIPFGLWIAVLAPMLLALNLPPSPTLLNQAAAFIGWGLVALYAWRGTALPLAEALRRSAVLVGALALVAVAALGSWAFGHLPSALAWSSAATLAATVGVVLLGAAVERTPGVIKSWFGAWLVAGLASTAIGGLQVFAPEAVDGFWLATSAAAGRAVGNLRQPNHLATLLLWSAVAVVALAELGLLDGSRGRRALAAGAMALLMLGIMLSGSRTGVVGLAVLCGWGLVDRRLGRFSRGLLVAAPLLFALAWALVAAVPGAESVGTTQRLGQDDLSGGRRAIWSDTLALIRANPWLGVGFGEFNLAWTLTPFPDRSPQFFDHTHNLPLQLLVELGLPLGGAVLALLLWSLWQGFGRVCAPSDGDARGARAALRAAFVMALLMGVHSLTEYPLWYAHFLLPTAFACGLCLGAGRGRPAAAGVAPALPAAPAARMAAWPALLGVALLGASLALLVDYRRVTTIFTPPEAARPLPERIAAGRASALFPHHADYALATALDDPFVTTADFARATHYLLDTRLMIAWAEKLAAQGDLQRARWIAARLREFPNPQSDAFFAPCADAARAARAFQCTRPERAFSWRDFR